MWRNGELQLWDEGKSIAALPSSEAVEAAGCISEGSFVPPSVWEDEQSDLIQNRVLTEYGKRTLEIRARNVLGSMKERYSENYKGDTIVPDSLPTPGTVEDLFGGKHFFISQRYRRYSWATKAAPRVSPARPAS